MSRKHRNSYRPPQQDQLPPQQAQIPHDQAQAQAMIAQQVAQISGGIYMRAAAKRLMDMDVHGATTEGFEELARDSHRAAKSYFAGLGLVQFKEEADTTVRVDR